MTDTHPAPRTCSDCGTDLTHALIDVDAFPVYQMRGATIHETSDTLCVDCA